MQSLKKFLINIFRSILNPLNIDLVSFNKQKELEFKIEIYRYAQANSIDVLSLYFQNILHLKEIPCFIQIGANDGIRDDEFRKFINNQQLCGLLIEPQTAPFQRLLKEYENNSSLILENCAVAPLQGTITLYGFSDTYEREFQLDVFTSFDKSIIEDVKVRLSLESEIVSVEVPCFPLNYLMNKNSLKTCDILVIDTEGFDFEILKSIDLHTLGATLVQIEHINLSDADLRSALEYLIKYGYQVMFNESRDIIAISSKFFTSNQSV